MRKRSRAGTAAWKLAPFIRLLFPFIAGIVIENKIRVSDLFLFPVLCLSIVLLIICGIISFTSFIGFEWVAGLAIQIVFFSLARILIHVHQDIQIEKSSCYVKGQSNLILAKLLADPVQKQNSYKCPALVVWLIKGQTCFKENERIFLYFSKKPDGRQYSGGSLVIFRKELRPIENSGSYFDYKRYCNLRHIYSQVFLKENDYSLVNSEKEKSLFSALDSLRNKLLVIIKKFVPGKSENSLLEALMVGYTDDLDPALMKSYADSGVIHIIAISGLHLALICHFLQLLMSTAGSKKNIKWLKFGIIITVLWGYSLFSGASPSVIRSAGMFSLVLFARTILRESLIYNTLAASAFLLLCFDPNWIWDTGFQLSYAAVLGLCLFSRPIRGIIPLKNKVLTSIWDAASVSIAAQVLTTPVCIYYFHRFPNYFLFANLLAVPLSSGILIGGIFLCICSFIQPLGRLFGYLVGFLIYFLNHFVNYISNLPGAVVTQLTLSLPQLIIVYIIIYCFYKFLHQNKFRWLISGLVCTSFFQIIRMIH